MNYKVFGKPINVLHKIFMDTNWIDLGTKLTNSLATSTLRFIGFCQVLYTLIFVVIDTPTITPCIQSTEKADFHTVHNIIHLSQCVARTNKIMEKMMQSMHRNASVQSS